ncbi:uncharacterized protein LOC105728087 isoform X2 [Aotus nancymaae]|uniref:uncharacterized protein LOC105728087 isoform X2 n=1 Tax=Aotus nancymaae TaxID=37293 RepID=UPI0030FDF9A0
MNTKVSSWTMCGTVYAHSARVCLDTRTAGVRGSRLLSTEDASDCSPPLPLEGEDSTGPVPVGELAIRTEDAGCLARCPPSPQWLAPSLWPLPYSVSSDSSMLRSRRECGQQGRGGSKAFRRNLEAAPTETNPRNTPSVNSSRDFSGLKPNFQLSVNLWICAQASNHILKHEKWGGEETLVLTPSQALSCCVIFSLRHTFSGLDHQSRKCRAEHS